MEVNKIGNDVPWKPLNIFSKTCLKNAINDDYLDEEGTIHSFSIDENQEQIAEIEIGIPSNKAVVQLIRLRMKDKKRQKEVLEKFVKMIWGGDICNNHLVLEINLYIKESGMDDHTLQSIGFLSSDLGASVYRILNPNYLDLVEMFSQDEEAKEKLLDYYYRRQKLKAKCLQRYEQECQNIKDILRNDPEITLEQINLYQYLLNSYEESIKTLCSDDQQSLSGVRKR